MQLPFSGCFTRHNNGHPFNADALASMPETRLHDWLDLARNSPYLASLAIGDIRLKPTLEGDESSGASIQGEAFQSFAAEVAFKGGAPRCFAARQSPLAIPTFCLHTN